MSRRHTDHSEEGTDLSTISTAHPISRKRWHARKRVQMLLGQPKNHDWDVLMLQGAAMRDVYGRERTPTKIPINSKKWLEKKENRVHIGASSKRKRSKPAQVGK